MLALCFVFGAQNIERAEWEKGSFVLLPNAKFSCSILVRFSL